MDPRMRTTGQSVARVGLWIDGKPVVAEPADDGTVIFALAGGRQAITSRGDDEVISLTTTPVDTEEADIAAADARVKAAAAQPRTPRADRPSARVAAARVAARQYHQATWSAGYAQAEADYSRRSLADRVSESDVNGLVEMAMAAVLANPELRTEFMAAVEAAALEEQLSFS
jgi:hypothetical protein